MKFQIDLQEEKKICALLMMMCGQKSVHYLSQFDQNVDLFASKLVMVRYGYPNSSRLRSSPFSDHRDYH